MTTTAAMDFGSSEFLADPYPAYYRLREHSPVHWFAHPLPKSRGGMWLITRYDDVKMVLQDPRFRKDMSSVSPELAVGPVPQSMLFRDPPDHTRLRGLVNLAFTPKMVRGLVPKITEIVGQLLERMAQQEAPDLIEHLALPLPVIVIAEMLGVPSSDRELFRDWSTDIVNGSDAFLATEERRQASEAAQLSLVGYLQELIQARRREAREDLISALLQAQEDERRLSEGDMLATCVLLLIAGHETTINLIGNGTMLLLRHPDQLARLRSDPGLLDSAVEEMLRFDSPVQRGTFRFAGEDLMLHGQKIAAGDQVSAVIGSANRDPSQFPDPDRFDIGREPNRHLSFGRGIHFCLGAPLARAEAKAAIGQLLNRFPRLEGDTSALQWRANSGLRGLRELPVVLS